MARPSSYTKEKGDYICSEIAEGRSLRSICDEDDTPNKETVRRWLKDNEEFRAQYAHAREDQAEHYANEIVEIADTEEDSQKARVRIDARKWVACKLLPKVYGDKLALGNDGDGPLKIEIVRFADNPTSG